MTIAANQPYLFPYLGYFQLIAAADLFVIADSLQFTKKTWMIRNRLLIQGKPRLITSSVVDKEHIGPINCKYYTDNFLSNWLNYLKYDYAISPYTERVINLIIEVSGNKERNVAAVNEVLLRRICKFIGIKTPIINLSELKVTSEEKVDRVIEITKLCDGDSFINLPGGRSLYDKEVFARQGIELKFLEPYLPPYRQQRTREFHPGLSILDLLCNLPPSEILEMVKSARFS